MRPEYFKVGVAMVDYLTATTYHITPYNEKVNWIKEAKYAKPMADKRRYYHGQSWSGNNGGTVFAGSASQKKGEHYMINASGAVSHNLALSMNADDWNCTRIDLQVTIPTKGGVTREWVDDTRDGKWSFKPRKITYIEGDEGEGSTLYIGSRQSARFIRFYEKLGTDGDWYTRFEIELKEGLADDALAKITNGGEGMIAPILLAELQMIPYAGEVPDFLGLWHELQTETWHYVDKCLLKPAPLKNGAG